MLLTDSTSAQRAEWKYRLIDYCGGGGGPDQGIIIGREQVLGDAFRPEQVEGATILQPEEAAPYWDRLSELVSKGHKAESLKAAMTAILS